MNDSISKINDFIKIIIDFEDILFGVKCKDIYYILK